MLMPITKEPIKKEQLLFGIEKLRDKHKNSSEPIPTYQDQEIRNLFDCINRGYLGYITEDYAIITTIFCNIIKNHYLTNGNKRIAVMVLAILCKQNYFIDFNNKKDLRYLAALTLKIADNKITSEQIITNLKQQKCAIFKSKNRSKNPS